MKFIKILTPLIVAGATIFVLFLYLPNPASAQEPWPPQPLSAQASSNAEHGGVNSPIENLHLVSEFQINPIISSVLDVGDEFIHGMAYVDGYVWATTRTSPARILKIDDESLNVLERIILSSGQDNGEDLVYAEGYLWAILSTEPSQLIRIDPATTITTTAITFDSAELSFGATLEYAFNYLWIGGINHLAQVDISNPLVPTYTIHDYADQFPDGYGLFHALTSGDSALWGTLYRYSIFMPDYFVSTTFLKIDPLDPSNNYITQTVEAFFPDDMVHVDGLLYTGSENPLDVYTDSLLYWFADDLSVSSMRVASSSCYGLFTDPIYQDLIWGTYVATPGKMIGFTPDTQKAITITLPSGFNDPNEVVFDPQGNMYVSTWQSPAGMVKFAPIHNQADLNLTGVISPNVVTAGMTMSYKLDVSNLGPAVARSVAVSVSLPAELNLLAAVPEASKISENRLIWEMGDLAASQQALIELNLEISASAMGSPVINAETESLTPDQEPTNNFESIALSLQTEADLAINEVTAPSVVSAGESFTYTLKIQNLGPSVATNVILSSIVPEMVQLAVIEPGGINCDQIGSDVLCAMQSLEPLASRELVFQGDISQPAADSISILTSIVADEPDPVMENNETQIEFWIQYPLYLPIILMN